jgi:hypothetical protein
MNGSVTIAARQRPQARIANFPVDLCGGASVISVKPVKGHEFPIIETFRSMKSKQTRTTSTKRPWRLVNERGMHLDEREPREAAAEDSRINSDRNGCLALAPLSGWEGPNSLFWCPQFRVWFVVVVPHRSSICWIE